MHSSIGATIAIGSVAVLLAGFSAATGIHASENEAAGTLALRDTALVDSNALKAKPHWVNDANVLSVLSVMNTRQIAAADIELEGWHSEDARTIAEAVARDHAELQHLVDSVVTASHIAPQSSALTSQIGLEMQRLVDTIIARRSVTLDRAFARQQVASDQLMSTYLAQLNAAAENGDVKTVTATVATRVAGQLARAKVLRAAFAIADSSAAADSATVRAARAERAAERTARAARAAQRIHQ
jgi:predicted outer membrane protein